MFKVNNKETRTTPKASSMPTVQLPHLFNPTIPQKTSNPNLSGRHFVAFSNVSLETWVPKLASLTRLSLPILGKTETGAFPISGFLVNPLLKKIFITPKPMMILI